MTPWAVSCQAGDPSLAPGGWRGRELRQRAAPRSFVSAGVTHTAERRHTPCINQAARYTAAVPARGAAGKLPALRRVEAVETLARRGHGLGGGANVEV